MHVLLSIGALAVMGLTDIWLVGSAPDRLWAQSVLKQVYKVRISYLSSSTQSYTARRVCGARCEWCQAAGATCSLHTDVFAPGRHPSSDDAGALLLPLSCHLVPRCNRHA